MKQHFDYFEECKEGDGTACEECHNNISNYEEIQSTNIVGAMLCQNCLGRAINEELNHI